MKTKVYVWNRSPDHISEEAFISKAESQWTVYSLEWFQNAFNADEVSTEFQYILIATN